MKKLALISSSLFALPFIAAAQTYGTLAPIQSLINSIGTIVLNLIPITIGLAMVVFFWGLVKYIQNPESKTGKQIMTAGLLSLFVMVSIWGIIALAQQAFLGSNANQNQINAPQMPR